MTCYSSDPSFRITDLRLLPMTSWEELDELGSQIVGRHCLAIPSVRVGMGWVLDHLGCNRHSHNVMVPKFMGRCILNALSRYALPVESLTNKTSLVVVVHQYGLLQQLDEIDNECVSKGIPYIEDSPYGLGQVEKLGNNSLAKFIGLTKILPVLKGALVISEDQKLLNYFKEKRVERSWWSWVVLFASIWLRSKSKVVGYSALADTVYEMYFNAKGDNAYFRGNISKALNNINAFSRMSGARLDVIRNRIGDRVAIPDLNRVPYVVPYIYDHDLELAQIIFGKHGFDHNTYHVDVARNLFQPEYKRALLIPTNPRIPSNDFDRLVTDLCQLKTGSHL